MSGDLGNLLTGELGEAEARFSHDDFAALYGRRIAGRVRRRRAVRAAGVGGGTMLTASALVVGVTQVPWGTLGATSGVGASDCVTPSASLGGLEYGVSIDTDQGSLANLSILYAATGGVIVNGVQQPDGTYLFTDGYGDALAVTQESSGFYTVQLPPGVTSLEATSTMAYRSNAVSTNYLSIYPPTVVRVSGSTPSPTGDCFTPDPTPSNSPTLSIDYTYSADPNLAAKPEDIIGDSPFECGFEFPTESYGTDDLWIDDVRWITGSEAQTSIESIFGDDPSHAPDVGTPAGPVPVVATHFASTVTGMSSAITWGTASPTVDDIYNELGRADAMLKAAAGATYVGVADGRVVATGTLPLTGSWTIAPVFLDPGQEEDGSPLYLLDRGAALTSCGANSFDVASIDLVAVAGVVVKRVDGTVEGPTYAWAPVGKP